MTQEEQKYWMEHYPHEAETIITLCDLFDETQDEAVKAQISYAIGVLRKKEKYARHDLRKNPKDLPKVGECVVTVIKLITNSGYKTEYRIDMPLDERGLELMKKGLNDHFQCLAWYYIEPFEEDNE